MENKFIKILVIEDEFTSRRILNSFLSPLVKLILPLMAMRQLLLLKKPLKTISSLNQCDTQKVSFKYISNQIVVGVAR